MSEAVPSFCIGSTANLIQGYKALWNPSDPRHLPFYPPQYQEFLQFPLNTAGTEAPWGPLQLELCPSKTALLEKLCGYKVSLDPDDSTHYPAGALLEEDIESDRTRDQFLGETGIDLSKPTGGYVLLTLTRIEQTLSHPAIEKLGFSNALFYKNEVMSHTLRRELVKLQAALHTGDPYQSASGKWQKRTDIQGIQRFIDFFDNYGTHYVSKVTTGDVIYQIFAYDEEAFALIQTLYQKPGLKLNRAAVLSFRKFTNPLSSLPHALKGYAAQIGHLCIKSRTESFLQQVAAGRWMDQDSGKNSIFNCAANLDQLLAFNQAVPIEFELAEILGFTRPALKILGNSIFKALMFTKYGNQINLFFKNQVANHPLHHQTHQDTNYLSVTKTDQGIQGYKNVLRIEDLRCLPTQEVKELRLLTPLLHLESGPPVHVPGDFVHIMAHALCTEGKPRELVLSDQAFDSFQIDSEDFKGALRLRNVSNSKNFTIVDGFQYQLAPCATDPPKQVVQLKGEINAGNPAAGMAALIPRAEHSLLLAELILKPIGGVAPDGHKIFVARYLNWLFALLPPEDLPSSLRIQGHWLARVVAKIELPKSKTLDGTDATLETAAQVLDQAGIVALKNSLAIQQQFFHLRRIGESETSDKTVLAEKKQVLLLNMLGPLRSMVDNYANLLNLRQLILEKSHLTISKTWAVIADAEQKLVTQQALFYEAVNALKIAIPDAPLTPSLQAILQQATTCLLPAVPVVAEKPQGQREFVSWFYKIQRLQNLRNTLQNLTTAAVLNQGMAELLSELGRNGLLWLSEAELQTLVAGFQNLIRQEFQLRLSDQATGLLENLERQFQAMIDSGSTLLAAQANLLTIHYHANFWDDYEARHQAQAAALTTIGPENLTDPVVMNRLTEIYHLHHQLFQRMRSLLLVLG